MGRSHTDLNKSILMERILNGTNSAEGESDILKDDHLVYILHLQPKKSEWGTMYTFSGQHTIMANVVNASALYGGAPFSTVRGYNLRYHIAQIHLDTSSIQGDVVSRVAVAGEVPTVMWSPRVRAST